MTNRDLEKEYKARQKMYQKRDKEYVKQLEKEDTTVEEEYEKLHPDYDKLEKESILDAIFTKEEDEEYFELLTDEEKEEYYQEVKETKIIMIKAAVIVTLGTIAFLIGAKIFVGSRLNYMDKELRPKIKQYYESKYNDKFEEKDLTEIIYKTQKTKEKKSEKINTGIYVATTGSNNHIIYNSNIDTIGDDISVTGIKDNFLSYMYNTIPEAGIIEHEVSLSYQDFYHKYNKFESYINALPADLNLVDLFNMSKLTAIYEATYQNDFDINKLQNTINMLTDESEIHLLKINYGDPVKYIKITKEEVTSIDITTKKELESNINYYQFDLNKNIVSNAKVSNISTSSMMGLSDEYSFTKAIKITSSKRKLRKEEKGLKDENFSHYYLIRMRQEDLNEKNVREVSKNKPYSELLPEKYEDYTIISSGGYSYIISEAKEIVLATKGEKKSFLCKLGIC